jgi:hypothetical protein
MYKSLKKALSVALLLGWAGAALSADAPASGQGSGSLPPTSSAPTQPAPGTGACCNQGCNSCRNQGCNSCCNQGCDNGCSCIDRDCCNDCVPGSGIIAGFEWHILRPAINNNTIATITTTSATTVATTVQNFQYTFSSDWSLWAGYRSCDGLGFTVNWFHANNSSDTFNTTLAPTATTTTLAIPPLTLVLPISTVGLPRGTTLPIAVGNDLHMDIWDFDVTQRVEVCKFDLTFGAGIRYFHVGEDYNGSIQFPRGFFGAPFAGSIVEGLGNSFNSGGPTLVLDGLRRFGCSGFGLYANARGGVLFGDKHDNGSIVVTGPAAPFAGFPTRVTTTSDNEETVGFGEIELGVQWSKRYCKATPFVRFGFEGREYWGVGNASAPGIPANSNANVGLYGVTASAGVGF